MFLHSAYNTSFDIIVCVKAMIYTLLLKRVFVKYVKSSKITSHYYDINILLY